VTRHAAASRDILSLHEQIPAKYWMQSSHLFLGQSQLISGRRRWVVRRRIKMFKWHTLMSRNYYVRQSIVALDQERKGSMRIYGLADCADIVNEYLQPLREHVQRSRRYRGEDLIEFLTAWEAENGIHSNSNPLTRFMENAVKYLDMDNTLDQEGRRQELKRLLRLVRFWTRRCDTFHSLPRKRTRARSMKTYAIFVRISRNNQYDFRSLEEKLAVVDAFSEVEKRLCQ
jgi:hypothetical protein